MIILATRRQKYNIHERKDGRLEIRETIDGVRKSFYGKTDNEVIAKYEEYKAQKHLFGTTIKEKQHFDEYMLQWLYTFKQRTLKPSSFNRLEITVLKWVNPTIGHIPVNKLTTVHIQELMIEAMYQQGLSASTIKKAYMAVNAACKHGLGVTFMYNPCDKVTLPSKHNFEKKDIRFLSDEQEIGSDGKVIPSELERFKTEALRKSKSVDAYAHRHGVSFVFILNTGLRSGEVRALKWKDFDEKNNTIHVCREVVREFERDGDTKTEYSALQETTKTKSSNRYVPLNKTALWCLNEAKKMNQNKNEEDLIFFTGKGTVIGPSNYVRSFKSICKNANIKDATVHSLRHTFATQLFVKGKDVKIVSDLLGHTDTKITSDIYIHVIDNQKAKAVLSLDEEI